ncbi:MAG TPA: hypothetical protein VF677_14720 [Flavobacterium sp.]|jgi:hypothetical protein
MNDTLIINQNISITQQYTQEKDNVIKWNLYAHNKKQNKTISLDMLYATIPWYMKKEAILVTPKAIDGFIKNNCLYIFVFQGLLFDLIEYDIKEEKVEKKRIATVAKLFAGTVDNFGGYSFDISKYYIENKLYFYITYRRSVGGGSSYKLIRFDNYSKKVFELKFSEETIKIKDEEETFKTLDLNKNKEMISIAIKKALLSGNVIKESDKIEYLDNIDRSYFEGRGNRTSNVTYFFYKQNKTKNKIAVYNNDEFEWEIGDYTEEEIKQPN